MGLDYDALQENPISSYGVGGISESYMESALLLFSGPGNAMCWYRLDLDLLAPDEHILGLPSLLGRDVLNHWHMRYSYPTNSLTFNVGSADQIVPLTR